MLKNRYAPVRAPLVQRLKMTGVDAEFRAGEEPGDHAPVRIEVD